MPAPRSSPLRNRQMAQTRRRGKCANLPGTPGPAEPVPWPSLGVGDGEHDDAFFLDQIREGKRKAREEKAWICKSSGTPGHNGQVAGFSPITSSVRSTSAAKSRPSPRRCDSYQSPATATSAAAPV